MDVPRLTDLSRLTAEDLGALSLSIVQHPTPAHAMCSGDIYHETESRPLEVMLKIGCNVGSDHYSCRMKRVQGAHTGLAEQQSQVFRASSPLREL